MQSKCLSQSSTTLLINIDKSYDASKLAFIATHTDDIAASEIISSLKLQEDPAMMEINGRITQATNEKQELEENRIGLSSASDGKVHY